LQKSNYPCAVSTTDSFEAAQNGPTRVRKAREKANELGLALEGKKIRTGRRQPPDPAVERIMAMVRQIEKPDKAVEETEHAKSELRRKLLRKADRGMLTNADARAYLGVKTDGELIEWAKTALPGLRLRLLGST
jgi:hypothetical protein